MSPYSSTVLLSGIPLIALRPLGVPGEHVMEETGPAQHQAGTTAPSAVVTLTASAEQTLRGRVFLFAVKHSAPFPFQAKASQGFSPPS